MLLQNEKYSGNVICIYMFYNISFVGAVIIFLLNEGTTQF